MDRDPGSICGGQLEHGIGGEHNFVRFQHLSREFFDTRDVVKQSRRAGKFKPFTDLHRKILHIAGQYDLRIGLLEWELQTRKC